MLVFKYVKLEESRYISHIDLLRHVSRILRRAGIPVKQSLGFNPHALVFFSPPLALGVGSVAEYLVADTDMDKEEAFERYNASVPNGLQATDVFECEKNPNLQARIVAADYVFDVPYASLPLGDELWIEYDKKGERVKENVRDKVLCQFEQDGKLALRLSTGAVNLRPDRLLDFLRDSMGKRLDCCDVTRTRQYILENEELKDVDNALQNASINR